MLNMNNMEKCDVIVLLTNCSLSEQATELAEEKNIQVWKQDFEPEAFCNSNQETEQSKIDNMTGLEFEEFCCKLLKANDFINVRRTPSSGDFGLDIIAVKDGIVYGIQCKHYQGAVGVKAVQEALSGCHYYSCHVPVVLTNNYFTHQAIEMANKTNVKLWNRKKLLELTQVFSKKDDIAPQTNTPKDTNISNASTDNIPSKYDTAVGCGCFTAIIVAIIIIIIRWILK